MIITFIPPGVVKTIELLCRYIVLVCPIRLPGAKHEQAKQLWEPLSSLPVRLFTTDYIFDEVVTLIRRGMDHRAAVDLGEAILNSKAVRLLAVTADTRHESWAMFKKYADKTFSFTDCTSFTLMRMLGLDCALAFDQHFSQMGFAVNRPPGRKLED